MLKSNFKIHCYLETDLTPTYLHEKHNFTLVFTDYHALSLVSTKARVQIVDEWHNLWLPF